MTDDQPMRDEDGYPTQDALERVKTWGAAAAEIAGTVKAAEYGKLLEFVKGLWLFADSGYWTEKDADNEFYDGAKIKRYELSTAGWSGNESLIEALQGNLIFWGMCWMQSQRGGHFIFEVPEWIL